MTPVKQRKKSSEEKIIWKPTCSPQASIWQYLHQCTCQQSWWVRCPRQHLNHEEDAVISRHGTLIVSITAYLKSCRIGFADQAATCGGAASRWSTSTAVWCLDTHRTSVGRVCQYQTLLPWIQWQRDVITLCCMKNETRKMGERGRGVEREIASYYLCSDNSLAEMEGLWWWAQCVFLWCQIGDLRIIYSWVYISNAYWLAKLFVLLASGLYSG